MLCVTAHVFISYSSEDRSYVEDLASFLHDAGVPVWYDHSLVGGENWSLNIQSAIRNCAAFIVVMTPSSEGSRWVTRELNYAERNGKPVIPLLHSGEAFFRLSDVHYGDVRGGVMPSPRLTSRLIELVNPTLASHPKQARVDEEDATTAAENSLNFPPGAGGVLYVMARGSPIARDVGILVDLAQRDGWEVCAITTPDGRGFVDVPELESQTGHPVRSHRTGPSDDAALPPADAMIVAPATANTLNKWAAGISDTLMLRLLLQGYGFGIPVVAVPYEDRVTAIHPRLGTSVAQLREWGVQVLYGDDLVRLGGPGQEERFRASFPWRLALNTLSSWGRERLL